VRVGRQGRWARKGKTTFLAAFLAAIGLVISMLVVVAGSSQAAPPPKSQRPADCRGESS